MIKDKLGKKVNGSPFSWWSPGRFLGSVTGFVLRKGKGFLAQPMCLLWFTVPKRMLMGKGSRWSLERVMELTPLSLHSDREGAFTTVFHLLFQTMQHCFAFHSGQQLSRRLWHQICKDLQGPRGHHKMMLAYWRSLHATKTKKIHLGFLLISLVFLLSSLSNFIMFYKAKIKAKVHIKFSNSFKMLKIFLI